MRKFITTPIDERTPALCKHANGLEYNQKDGSTYLPHTLDPSEGDCRCGYTCEHPDAIHEFFELSYAQYLTIPRTVLQSMPDEWQSRFTSLLEDLDRAVDWRPAPGLCYRVQLYQIDVEADSDDYWMCPVSDPFADYERGRRRVPINEGYKGD